MMMQKTIVVDFAQEGHSRDRIRRPHQLDWRLNGGLPRWFASLAARLLLTACRGDPGHTLAREAVFKGSNGFSPSGSSMFS